MYLSDLHNSATGGLGTGACNPRREKDGKSLSCRGERARKSLGVCARAGAGAGAGARGPAWLKATLRNLEKRLRLEAEDREEGAMAERGPGSCAGPGGLA
jgi:hypothetical protein